MQHPRRHMKKLTTAFGAPVDDNQNIATAGERGPALLQNIWFLEKLAHFDREVIPERRMHAKGSGASAPSRLPMTSPSTPRRRSSPRSGRRPKCLRAFRPSPASVAPRTPSETSVD